MTLLWDSKSVGKEEARNRSNETRATLESAHRPAIHRLSTANDDGSGCLACLAEHHGKISVASVYCK